jgi:hypothetical protein
MATQVVQNLPAQFVQDLGQDLAKQVIAQSGVPTVSVGLSAISQRPGETTADFQARQQAAREFETRQQSLAGLAPTVAAQDALQRQAQTLATGAAGTTGLASFQPFLTRAEQGAQVAAGLGTQALGQLGTAGAQLTQAGTTLGGIPTGAATSAQIQQFMSPYQAQVIDASLQEFDRNKAIQEINRQLWVRSAVVERECNSQSLAQGLRENGRYYKPVSCNKVFNKHKLQDNKT